MENVLAVHEQGSRPATRDADDEQRWLARARQGDVAAFEQLYRAHVGRIHAVCLRLAGDPGVAEECVQEAFITAWRKLDGFRGDSAFGSWLYRVATNEVMGHFRRQGRRDRHLQPVSDHEWESFTESEAEAGTDMDLEAAIAQLPEGARTVFVLHDVEGRQHDEIAELVGIAVGTSKAQLHRARRLLRERLKA
ncbi:MAG: sigma-70 family RNA polymerase sigma factor [Gammaproteobacteria bacterium]|nr:sigma-70 family RNA polymerase sigma factor [Gammaproteobacteria bacterium]